MDGTAAISRKRGERHGKGKGSREERSEMTEIKRGRKGRRSRGRVGQRGNKLEKGQRSETSACQAHANDDTRRVATSQRGMIFFFLFSEKKKKKRADETVPGLLWHGDEHPALSLCQSRCIPRPWQQLLATSSSCVKSAYVLMNVSAPPNRVIAVCVSIHLRAQRFYPRCTGARVTLAGNYFGLNNYVGPGWEVRRPRLCSSLPCQI